MGFRNLNFSDGSVVGIMAPMNTNTHALAGQQPLFNFLWADAAALLVRLAAAMRRRRARACRPGADELQAMSDLDLKDLGLGRSEVGHALESGRA